MVSYLANGILLVGALVAIIGIGGIFFYLKPIGVGFRKRKKRSLDEVIGETRGSVSSSAVVNEFDFEDVMDMEAGIKGVDKFLKRNKVEHFIRPINDCKEEMPSVQAYSFGDVYFENTIDNLLDD